VEEAEFERWLGESALLNFTQRRRARLVLSDGPGDDDAEGVRGRPLSNGTARRIEASFDGDPVATKPPARRPPSPVDAEAVAVAGRRRVESLGCPHCSSRDLVAWGQAKALPRYRCKGCGRTFNALTKTPMARLRKKERWLENANAMVEGTSIAKAAERCGVNYTTAFRWRHRFLASPANDKTGTPSGIVEADEMFILELLNEEPTDLPRASRKRAGTAAKRARSVE